MPTVSCPPSSVGRAPTTKSGSRSAHGRLRSTTRARCSCASAEPSTPFVGEIDANVRLPRSERTGAERLELWPLSSADEVGAIVRELDALRVLNEQHQRRRPAFRAGRASCVRDSERRPPRSSGPLHHRRHGVPVRQAPLRLRRHAPRRGCGRNRRVHHPPTRLRAAQVRREIACRAPPDLVAHAADFADFAQALGGTHLAVARNELDELVRQKLRLGLLSDEVPFRHFPEDDPEYLVAFWGYDLVVRDARRPARRNARQARRSALPARAAEVRRV